MEQNKIYHGYAEKLIKDLPDKSVDCIYTDIPYLYQQGGSGSSELGARTARKRLELMGIFLPDGADFNAELKKAKKDKTLPRISIEDGIDYAIFEDFRRVMKRTNLFIWCSKLQVLDIMNYWVGKHDCLFEILTWNKTNPTPQVTNTWLPDIEYCLFFRERGVPLNDGYELKSKWFISPTNKSDKDLFNHATIKPFELVVRHLRHATQDGAVILDPYMGSGTTAVAALEVGGGRSFIGFELDEQWVKVANERLNKVDQNGQACMFLR